MSPEVTNMLFTLGIGFLTILFTVLWFLLRKKDEAQEASIKILFAKHDEDVKKLQELEVYVAKNIYVKEELDRIIDRLQATIAEGFRSFGLKLDELNKSLTEHMREGDK